LHSARQTAWFGGFLTFNTRFRIPPFFKRDRGNVMLRDNEQASRYILVMNRDIFEPLFQKLFAKTDRR
jgi:hypothetical protein